MRKSFIIDPKKATIENSIPSKTLNLNPDIFADVLQNLFNDMLSTGNFQDNMKIVDITPSNNTCFQEKRPFKKENYRPESVLSAISKIL